ncbi:unnamed protein product [Rotaria socialis]|uniref:Uncharacterized protein n=1 Tax=Rotaria socialis TaxID=392032 RepID=A0A818QPL1_9BILA|nr:unnamed protein product [Rotaria socialis]CAF3641832.1 unnamed protein product [Rotaria socialis]CAF3732311.1 unnamed protein product [Rotaria socialis]CAF4544992.1 unnamed protein product [Rotaria socialis]CAF4676309.1 unnamed protein product [Rotaria socialis]
MPNLSIDKKEKDVLPLSNHENLMGLINPLKTIDLVTNNQFSGSQLISCKSMSNLSTSKQNDDLQNEIDSHIIGFQKYQWAKYGRTMPTNWIDPFETYD